MSLRSVPRPLVLIPVLVLLLVPLPAFAAEGASGQATVWSTRFLGSLYEEVAGWLDSFARVVKLGPEMDPDGARASDGLQEGGVVAELGPDIDPNG